VLLRLAYLGLTNTFARLRLLPMTNRDKDIEILVLRHQIAVLQRQLGGTRVQFSPTDRALLAALLHRLPRQTLAHAQHAQCRDTPPAANRFRRLTLLLLVIEATTYGGETVLLLVSSKLNQQRLDQP
jgi:hypothetical protein